MKTRMLLVTLFGVLLSAVVIAAVWFGITLFTTGYERVVSFVSLMLVLLVVLAVGESLCRRLTESKPHWRLIVEYSDAIALYGPDSVQALVIREKHKDTPGFLKFADGLDKIKREIGFPPNLNE